MLVAAKMLAKSPFDKLDNEVLETMLTHGNIAGAFICGARWADKNPDSPWVDVNTRMPEDSLPELSDETRMRKSIKAFVNMMDGRLMEVERRIGLNGKWYWNMDIRMREQITHWMPVPSIKFMNSDN